jgi:hypothetical protein
MIERGFGDAELCRADLPGPGWSLHPHARGDEFVRLLPAIIEAVEAGRFPPAQAGRYNMDFDAWRGLLAPAVAAPRSPISNRQVE